MELWFWPSEGTLSMHALWGGYALGLAIGGLGLIVLVYCARAWGVLHAELEQLQAARKAQEVIDANQSNVVEQTVVERHAARDFVRLHLAPDTAPSQPVSGANGSLDAHSATKTPDGGSA